MWIKIISNLSLTYYKRYKQEYIEHKEHKEDKNEYNVETYFDIPIINKFKHNLMNWEQAKDVNETMKETKMTINVEAEEENEHGLSKNRIIEEILKGNYNRPLNDSLNHPFTPPFTKFHNFEYINKEEKVDDEVNVHEGKEEKFHITKYDNDELVSNSTGKKL